MAEIILYSIPQVIILTVGGTGASFMDSSSRRTDIIIVQGIQNDIDIFLKDADRKPVPLMGKSAQMLVSDLRTGSLLDTFNLVVIDEVRGLFRLTVLPTDTPNWDIGFLQYAVTLTRADGSSVPCYVDYNYQVHGTMELVGGMTPAPAPPVTVDGLTDFMAQSWGQPLLSYAVTGGFPSTAPLGDSSILQTAAVYTTNFTGQFWIQATLENNVPTDPNDWFNVTIGGATPYFTFAQTSGITTFNFTGCYQFVRFVYMAGGQNTGTVDQVLYRN